jgi:hypothetical protein
MRGRNPSLSPWHLASSSVSVSKNDHCQSFFGRVRNGGVAQHQGRQLRANRFIAGHCQESTDDVREWDGTTLDRRKVLHAFRVFDARRPHEPLYFLHVRGEVGSSV